MNAPWNKYFDPNSYIDDVNPLLAAVIQYDPSMISFN